MDTLLAMPQVVEAVAFLAFSSVWFWAFVVIVSFLIWASIENEKGFFAFLLLAGAVTAICVWGDRSITRYVAANPWKTAGYILAYFSAGTLWGLIKWWRYTREERHKYDDAFESFKKSFNDLNYRSITHQHLRYSPDDPERRRATELFEARKKANTEEVFREEWAAHIEMGSFGGISFEYKPKWKKHIPIFHLWIGYWPWSMLWTVIHDPVKKILKAISRLLNRISLSSFKGTDEYDPERIREERRLKEKAGGVCDRGHNIVKSTGDAITKCDDCMRYIEANPKIVGLLEDENARSFFKSMI